MSGNWKSGAGVSGIIVAILAVIGLVFGGANSTPDAVADTGDRNVSINIMGAGGGCDVMEVATRAMLNRGFVADQFVIGEDQINWDEPEANERGDGAFVEETPKSATQVVDQLKADDESARAAKASLLETSGATEEELLTAANWVPAQFKTKVELPGNTAFSGGKAQSVGTRQSDSGEVIWLFVNPESCPEIQLASAEGNEEQVNQLAEEATTAYRAGCGNPQTELPVPPGDSPSPDTTTSTTPSTTTTVPPTTSTTLTPKDPSRDINRPGCGTPGRPPCQVTGPGTTPVGQDPGPATPSCDTPTGYCPGSEPTTTTTTRPPSSGSGGSSSPTTVPSCGSPGQPSCNNTGDSPPTTSAPPAPPPPDQPPQDGMPDSP